MANDILIDGARLAWPEFADSLMTLRDEFAAHPRVGYVRAPRQSRAEAARLIAALDLSDCVTMLDELPPSTLYTAGSGRSSGLLSQTPQQPMPVLAILRGVLDRSRGRPLHD